MQLSPLYLDISKAKQVSLEGPALCVKTQAGGQVCYPLRRLARVVVTGRVQWETMALLACLEYGVPVAFRQRDGRLLGHCLSERSSRVNLETLLRSAANHEEGEQVYQSWKAACEVNWLKRSARQLGLHYSQFLGRVAERELLPLLEDVLPCPVSQFRQQLQGPMESHLLEVMAAYGFSDNVYLPLTPRMHVYRDLLRFLWWELCLQLLREPPPFGAGSRGLRFCLVQYHQSQADWLEKRSRIALDRLWRHLKRLEVD